MDTRSSRGGTETSARTRCWAVAASPRRRVPPPPRRPRPATVQVRVWLTALYRRRPRNRPTSTAIRPREFYLSSTWATAVTPRIFNCCRRSALRASSMSPHNCPAITKPGASPIDRFPPPTPDIRTSSSTSRRRTTLSVRIVIIIILLLLFQIAVPRLRINAIASIGPQIICKLYIILLLEHSAYYKVFGFSNFNKVSFF